MSAKSSPCGQKNKEFLTQLGSRIRAHRKQLKISTVSTSEAAGVSRMTLNRIEKGEPSVTIGAYINVLSVLGLELMLTDPSTLQSTLTAHPLTKNSQILLSDYPQLKKLAWQVKKSTVLTPKEALSLYERNWRHLDQTKLKPKEQKFIQSLLALFGKERRLV